MYLWRRKEKKHNDLVTRVISEITIQIAIIDWELSPPPQLQRFNARQTVRFRDAKRGGHPAFGVYESNPMIGDRGTNCDSIFRDCICNFPYEFVVPQKVHDGAYSNNYHCNLFGMPIEKSWDVAEGLAARLSAARASGIDDSNYWGPAWHHIQDLLEPQKLTRPPAGKEWFPAVFGRQEL